MEGVIQTTWEDLIISLLPKKVRLVDHQQKIALFLEKGLDNSQFSKETIAQASLLRGSMAMKTLLDKYIDRRVANMIPKIDLVLDDRHRMTRKEIYRKFHEDYQHYPYMHRRQRLIQSLTQWKADTLKEIVQRLESRIAPGMYQQTEETIARMKAQFQKALDEYCEQIKGVDIQRFYQKIMSMPENIATLLESSGLLKLEGSDLSNQPHKLEQLVAYLKQSQGTGKIEWEDLAAIFYLTYRFYGLGKFKKYSHIVADEAQDLTPFQLYALGLLTNNHSMSILGDVSQSIYGFKGMTSWEPLQDRVFDAKVSLKTLKKSYRSTIEIISVANEVLKKWDNPKKTLAEPVLRHGDEPLFRQQANESELYASLASEVTKLKQEGFKNIALIDKTTAQCQQLYKKLADKGLDSQVITIKENRYQGGVSIVPIYLSKGMEFDAVILVNPSAEKYNEHSPTDIKLLYVAITRALHRLIVIYTKELTPLLTSAEAMVAKR